VVPRQVDLSIFLVSRSPYTGRGWIRRRYRHR